MADEADDRDEALLARFAKQGDRDAAGRLVLRHHRAAYDLAFRILRTETDAADATQAAFLKVLQSAASFRETAAFRTWLYRIVVNEALKHRAASERRRTMETPIDRHEETLASPDAEHDRLLAALDREVDDLDDAHRMPVLLHYYRGLSYDEAAAVLDCAPGTVGSRLAAAREKLRTRLAAFGVAAAVPDLEKWLRAVPASEPPAALHGTLSSLAASTVAETAAVAWIPWAVGGALVAAGVAVVASTSGGREPQWIRTNGTTETVAQAPAVSPAPAPERKLRSLGYIGDPPPNADARRSEPVAGDVLRVSGMVYDRATGLPQAGVTVALEQVWPLPPFAQTKDWKDRPPVTDSTGAYSVEATHDRPAIYRLHVWPGTEKKTATEDAVLEVTGEQTVRIDFPVGTATQADYERLQAEPERKLVMAIRDAVIRDRTPAIVGTIRRADGKPLAHHPWIQLFDEKGAEHWQHTLAIDVVSGDFVLAPAPSGPVRLDVVATGEGFAVLDRLELVAEGPTTGVLVTLRCGDAAIEGIVVDETGRPIAEAGINAMPIDLRDPARLLTAIAEARTDDGGRFRLENVGAAGDRLRLIVSAPAMRINTLDDVKAGASELRIVLRPFARVFGRVLLRATGAPPDDFEVHFGTPRASKSDRPVQIMLPGTTRTPSEGRFSSIDALGGEVTVTISVEGHESVSKTVTVGDDDLDLGDILID